MKENTQEKSLAQINENGIFYKIKNLFRRLFHKEEVNNVVEDQQNINTTAENDNRKNSFVNEIRKVEDEETKLLKLQKQYRSGEIKEEELSDEQIISLSRLYDKQIANLRKSNEIQKQKLLEYRKKLQTNN